MCKMMKDKMGNGNDKVEEGGAKPLNDKERAK